MTSVVNVLPSWLAWSVPVGMARPPTAIVTARAGKGSANSNWIQAGASPSARGSATVWTRSPSKSAAGSKSPPLRVTFGGASAIFTSPAGRRYAITALSP